MTTTLYTYTESTLTASDGLALYTQSWQAAQPKGSIVLIHGISEHSTRYRHVGEFWATHGYTVHTMDLRGHGRSPGQRIFVRQIEEHSRDVGTLLTWARQQEPTLPLFLFGHSMGGLIVTYYTLTQSPKLNGVILSGPALKLNGASPLLVAIGHLIARIYPTFPMAKIDTTGISRDATVVQANLADTLIYHDGVPVATALALVKAVTYVQTHWSAFHWPLLILQGTADRIVNPAGSEQFYAQAGSTDKTLKRYDGLYHEVLNEPEKEQIMAEVVEWLDKHL